MHYSSHERLDSKFRRKKATSLSITRRWRLGMVDRKAVLQVHSAERHGLMRDARYDTR
jgi:hypothetical protein